MSMNNAFSQMLHDIFVDTIPGFLMSEPVIYVVGLSLCFFAVGIFHKLTS